jgi:predicted nucleotidyltransferase
MTKTNDTAIAYRQPHRVQQLTQAVAGTIIETNLPVVAVYLHGSWASEYERDDSDLDLAILAEHRLELSELIKFQQGIAAHLNLHVEIDLADLYSANTVFAAIVITTGERLYSSGIAADIFEVKTLAAYARLNEERHDILQNIFQRGTVFAPSEIELT